jgi:hypothetical protein
VNVTLKFPQVGEDEKWKDAEESFGTWANLSFYDDSQGSHYGCLRFTTISPLQKA